MIKNKIGIMQGRLTEPKGRGIQFFPFENWAREFEVAKEIGLNEIECIFDYENYTNNPLWSDVGIKEVNKKSLETGISINAVCFDYFMRIPFIKESKLFKNKILNENKEILKKVLYGMNILEIPLIEIPLVDNSSLKTIEEGAEFREFILKILEDEKNIKFGLETDLEPHEFKHYINSFNTFQVGANYDSGNSSGLGYDVFEEVTTLGNSIFNIHIKDRIYHGSTVPLGTGSANFINLFQGLEKINYEGSYILQAARGNEGKEKETILMQKKFIEDHLKKKVRG